VKTCAVIGGGIAGLTAAAYLARAGVRVTVFEAADQAGGFVASYRKGGFTFDVGARAAENSGSLFPMLRELGLDVEFQPNPYGLGVEGRIFPVWDERGIGDFYDEIARHYPHERGSVERIKEVAYRASSLMSGRYSLENPIFSSTLLSGITDDQDLVNLITQPYFAGSTAAFALGYGRLFRDYHYPRGGMGSLTRSLARFIENRGGTVRTSCPVSRILVENGKVSGVGRAWRYPSPACVTHPSPRPGKRG